MNYSPPPKLRSFTLGNLNKLKQFDKLTAEQRRAVEVVGRVLPFKTNEYVCDNLIDWNNLENDAIFKLNFPQKEMLQPEHYQVIEDLLDAEAPLSTLQVAANEVRMQLNPHPAGQQKKNVPTLAGQPLEGMQHKYRETVLFFPGQGQTCHAYCTFCFRWPQFVGISELKFASREVEILVEYLKTHKEVQDVLFTGGDPMIMKAESIGAYIEPLLQKGLEHVQTIRIGSKALTYWPYRFTTEKDSDELLRVFEKATKAGKQLAFMAHFNHPRELETSAVKKAISRIRSTGANIRTQAPLMRHINDDADLWQQMWKKQVRLGMIPYYMFLARDTGAQHYFAVPLAKAYRIFKSAFQRVSGTARTVRGPSMSCDIGKVHVLGISEQNGKKVFVLQLLQARDPDAVVEPFFAEYDPEAIWYDDLKFI